MGVLLHFGSVGRSVSINLRVHICVGDQWNSNKFYFSNIEETQALNTTFRQRNSMLFCCVSMVIKLVKLKNARREVNEKFLSMRPI